MLAASPHAIDRSSLRGAIRTAEPRDTDGVARLLAASNQNAAPTTGDQHAHLLVLDVDGAVRAVERVVMGSSRASIQLLVVDPELATSRIEIADRMLGVALALCEAYGCVEIDVVATQGRL